MVVDVALTTLATFPSAFARVYTLRTVLHLVQQGARRGLAAPQVLLRGHARPAVRLALPLALYAALYALVRRAAARRQGSMAAALQGALGGAAAAPALVLMERETRGTLVLFAAVRALQSLYNWAKTMTPEGGGGGEAKEKEEESDSRVARKSVKSWLLPLPAGDVLLFATTAGMVMYNYVMHPEFLPASYWNFIVKAGPIDKRVLHAVRASHLGERVNERALHTFLGEHGKRLATPLTASGHVPCSVLHPQSASCVRNQPRIALDTLRFGWKIYLAIHLIPAVLTRRMPVPGRPLASLGALATNTLRSSAFLSTLVALYQGTVCVHHRFLARDHWALYYVAGLVAGLSVLWEKRSRRSELALYSLARALDTAAQTAGLRRVAFRGWRTLGCALSLGVLFHFYETDKQMNSSAVNRVIANFIDVGPRRDAEPAAAEKPAADGASP